MNTTATFQVGRILTTRQVSDLSAVHTPFAQFVWRCLTRHQQGDWGDCCPEDKATNDQALKLGNRLLSVYLLPQELQFVHRDSKIWILTEADRSATTVLFPSEY